MLFDRLWKRAPAAALLMIVSGVRIGWPHARGSAIPHLTDYTLGARPDVDVVGPRLPEALRHDYWFIVGYGLVLAGCALYFRTKAISSAGRSIANFVGAAVLLTVAADAVEDVLLSATLGRGSHCALLLTTTAAAATIKFSALPIALFGIPASLLIVLRNEIARWWSKKHTGPDAQPWWEAALVRPAPPEPNRVARESTTEPGESKDALLPQQQSWWRAYDVPGVNERLRRRPGRALCLSGGGVRSACVAMGAMQVFSERPVQNSGAATNIDELDYIVSVSGGGYAAGARLMGVQRPADRTEQPDEQPHRVSERFERGSAEFDHVRRGSSYLSDSPASMVSALGEVLNNLVSSLLTVFVAPALLGCVAGLFLARIPIAAMVPVPARRPQAELAANPCLPAEYTVTELRTVRSEYFWSLVPHPHAYWALAFFAVWVLVFAGAALLLGLTDAESSSVNRRAVWVGLARMAVGFAVVVFVCVLALPALMRLCWWASGHSVPSAGGALATLSGVAGLNYVTALIAMIRRKTKSKPGADRGGATTLLKRVLPAEVLSLLLIIVTLAVLVVVWLGLLGGFAAGAFHYVTEHGSGDSHLAAAWWWVGGLFCAIVFLGTADVTSTSLHPFYRRRLARTFAVRRDPPEGIPNVARRYGDDEATSLPDYGRVAGGPEFVFACAATVTGQDKPAPGLNAVSYVMTADYLGGPELGWLDTGATFGAAAPRIKRDLTVQAAVAVSGAAFASAMGRQNKGIEKLLAISGARLGTWLPNPAFVTNLCGAQRRSDRQSRAWPKALPIVRGAGYLYREIVGANWKDDRLVQVTDGGHYDNSGLVEALRRRCRLVICIDGGGDPPPLLGGLTDAIRLAEYELGVQISFYDRPATAAGERPGTRPQTPASRYPVDHLAPGSGRPFDDDPALAGIRSRITRSAVVVGRIRYPAAAELTDSTGFLVYAKAVLTQRCPFWLQTYAASSPIFPHDPTSDQWFTEGQFAAYTELGAVIGREVVECVESLRDNSL